MNRNLLNHYFTYRLKIVTLLIMIFSTSALPQKTQRVESKVKTKLEGRVIADVIDLVSVWHPRNHNFIFAANQTNDDRKAKPVVVRIIYEYFSENEDLTPAFLDYTKFYEMKVFRRNDCDGKLKDFGYAQTNTENKMGLLRIVDGADKSLLDENKVLPCYVLKGKNYKLKRVK